MTPSMNYNRLSFANVGALSHLVEAASTLTELEVEPLKRVCQTALVSDDDEILRVTAKASDNTTATTTTTTTTTSTNAKKKEIFPEKLMEILADSSLSDIVSWLPHGLSFVIIRPDLFCEQVLPKYLPPADSRGSTKYPSFTRKLNRWGFRQATRGADTGAFHHQFFRRDEPEFCTKMVCQKSRDRQQQGMQKQQRSLPPKKRTIHEIAPTATTFTPSSITNTLPISGTDALVAATKIYQLNPPAPVSVSADDGSVGNSSTTSSASSFSNAVTFNNNSECLSSVKTKPQVPVTTVTTQTITNSSTTGMGGRGILPFISNDSQFVASILRQREALEVFRASKAMLYDAYMKAMNEQQTT